MPAMHRAGRGAARARAPRPSRQTGLPRLRRRGCEDPHGGHAPLRHLRSRGVWRESHGIPWDPWEFYWNPVTSAEPRVPDAAACGSALTRAAPASARRQPRQLPPASSAQRWLPGARWKTETPSAGPLATSRALRDRPRPARLPRGLRAARGAPSGAHRRTVGGVRPLGGGGGAAPRRRLRRLPPRAPGRGGRPRLQRAYGRPQLLHHQPHIVARPNGPPLRPAPAGAGGQGTGAQAAFTHGPSMLWARRGHLGACWGHALWACWGMSWARRGTLRCWGSVPWLGIHPVLGHGPRNQLPPDLCPGPPSPASARARLEMIRGTWGENRSSRMAGLGLGGVGGLPPAPGLAGPPERAPQRAPLRTFVGGGVVRRPQLPVGGIHLRVPLRPLGQGPLRWDRSAPHKAIPGPGGLGDGVLGAAVQPQQPLPDGAVRGGAGVHPPAWGPVLVDGPVAARGAALPVWQSQRRRRLPPLDSPGWLRVHVRARPHRRARRSPPRQAAPPRPGPGVDDGWGGAGGGYRPVARCPGRWYRPGSRGHGGGAGGGPPRLPRPRPPAAVLRAVPLPPAQAPVHPTAPVLRTGPVRAGGPHSPRRHVRKGVSVWARSGP